jgi:predicted Zn-dependent peptidase
MRRLIAGFIGATAFATSVGAVTAPSVTFTDEKLSNGLRLIIAEDHVAPVFSIAIVFNVGSRNERSGRTGFAHLFEHMMFKGSENVGPGEHFYTVFSNGGTMNGTTNQERTLYFETMPANQLEAGLFLEADRMRSLAITKDNLDNQRYAVQEERRQGLDNQPYGRTNEAIDDLAFDNPAYKHSVIGSMNDLNAASTEDVAKFFQMYYAPNNAIMAVTGDVKTAEVRALAKKYLESIPPQPAPPSVDVSQPPQTAERRLALEDGLARLPRVDISYHIPPTPSADNDAIESLTRILANGRSSRLYEAVVRQRQLAVNVGAFAGDSRGPRLLRIVATPAPGNSPKDMETAIYAEIEKLKTGPIESWEIDKARNGWRRQLVNEVGSSLSRAINLAEYALYYDDPGRINTTWRHIDRVTATDVQRVAKQLLTPENRSVIVTTPKANAGRGGL